MLSVTEDTSILRLEPFLKFAKRHRLTPRETEILQVMVVKGYTNEQLADAMAIKYKTAVNHMANVLTKTKCGSTRELLAKVVNVLIKFILENEKSEPIYKDAQPSKTGADK